MITPKLRNTALLVAGCYFMENLDSTIVTTAVPAMSRALDVSSAQMGLIVTAYMVTLAVFIPISGWLAERFGTRRVFLSAIAIFTLASLACALSPSLETLVAARVLQGFGGALMVPVGRVVVIKHTEKRDLLRIMSYLVWPGLISPAIAPLAGGLIITYASWEYLFLINIPLGIAGFIAAWKLINDDAEAAPSRLDGVGVALTGIGVGGLTYAAHVLADSGAAWSTGLLLTAVFLVVIAIAVRHLLTAANPIVELRILTIPTFRASQLGSSMYWMMVGSAPFMLTLLFQNVFGWSPTLAGGIVLFIFVGNIGIKPATTFLLNRFGFRRVLIVSTSIGALTMILNGLITPAVPIILIALLTLLSGVVRSTALTAYSTMAYSDISPENTRHANALAATMQNLAAAFGIASATVALRAGEPIAHFITGSSSASGPYTVSFFILGIIASFATLGAVRLDPGAGNALRRQQPQASLNRQKRSG